MDNTKLNLGYDVESGDLGYLLGEHSQGLSETGNSELLLGIDEGIGEII